VSGLLPGLRSCPGAKGVLSSLDPQWWPAPPVEPGRSPLLLVDIQATSDLSYPILTFERSIHRRLSAFAAHFDFSHAAACLAFATTPARGTRRFISEYVERAWDFVSEDFPFSVAH
jgi:hypothetical protein